MKKAHAIFATALAASVLLAGSGQFWLADRHDGGAPDYATPSALSRFEASAEDEATLGAQLRERFVEVTEELHVDLLEKLAGAIEPVGSETVVALSGPEPKTLYFHSVVADLDRAGETAGATPGPRMDEAAPTGPVSKVQSAGLSGNANFRKNVLVGYFGGAVHGTVQDPSITMFVQGADRIEVTLFGDGGIGVSTVAARKTVTFAPAPIPTAVTVEFPGVQFDVLSEMVVSYRVLTATPATTLAGTPAALYHDSTTHPSAISFILSPISNAPKLDDPTGLAFRDGKTVVMSAGSGVVFELDGATMTSVASGFFPGGFLRGLGDAVTDLAGNVYFAETDTGKVHFLRPDGSTGVYAEGLGAPTGLAFGATGSLFVGDSGTGAILKVAPDGTVTEVARLPTRLVYDLAFAPDGSLTASTFRPAGIWNVDVASGAVALRVSLGGKATAEGLAYDVDGSLWLGSARENATGRLLRLAPDNTLAVVDSTVGGPLHLAFVPGSPVLAVATQGELVSPGDAVLTFATPVAGLAVAAPSLTPTDADDGWEGWVHGGDGTPLPASAFAGVLPVGEMLDVGRDPQEPILAIQSDGDLFTVAASVEHSMLRNPVVFGAGEPAVMRSQDNGDTWENVSPRLAGINDPPATADPFVYVDPDTDRVFTFDLTGACHYLSYSDDSGDSWKTNRLACGVPPVDHQSIISAKPRITPTVGYPNVLYHCTNWVALSPCGRSLDGGDTWSPAGLAYQNVRDPQSGCTAPGGLMGHLGADLEGRVFSGKSQCGVPVVAITEDDGVTWTVRVLSTPVGISGHDIDFAVDEANNVYAAWIAANGQLVYAASTDHGATWGPAHKVGPGGLRSTQMPAIAASGVGQVAFSYIGSPTNYGYATQNAGKMVWNSYMTVTLDALAAEPVLATINPHAPQDPIARGSCARPCSSIWDFLDVRIGPDGRAWATTVDACAGPCVTDRSVAMPPWANTQVATFSAGPNLRAGGALGPR